MSGYDYVSVIAGCTTAVEGRFALRGPSFELLSDGSVASGGPGRAPGPLDLLVAALVTNLLNVVRESPDDADGRTVQVRARTSRYPGDRVKVGRLQVDVLVADLGADEVEALLAEYRSGCRVLPAVETVLDVVLTAVDPDDVR